MSLKMSSQSSFIQNNSNTWLETTMNLLALSDEEPMIQRCGGNNNRSSESLNSSIMTRCKSYKSNLSSLTLSEKVTTQQQEQQQQNYLNLSSQTNNSCWGHFVDTTMS